ncbi:hypothetical protein V1507DRAFT_34120 [Lipomyces tetrasporus]
MRNGRIAQYKAARRLTAMNALIKGGDSGIDRSIEILFAREGANVGIVPLPEEKKMPRTPKGLSSGILAARYNCIQGMSKLCLL